MKIGFISHWYDPEGGAAAGPGTIARALAERGHDVHVLTGYPIYPQGSIFPQYRMRPYMKETLRGVTVHRVPIYPSHNTSAARRMCNYASYAATGGLAAPAVLGSTDVNFVYSTPATAAVAGLTAKWVRRTPFVVQIQDMWPQTVMASGFLPDGRARQVERILNMFCDRVYRNAHSVAVTSPGMADHLIQRGVASQKIHFVPNWAEESSFRPAPRSDELAQEFGLDRRFTVMYAGNLGEMQNLMHVVEAAAKVRDLIDVQFAFVGAGVMEGVLRDAVRNADLDNVRFVPAQPFNRMSNILALGDIQLVTLKDEPLYRSTIPSKLQANLAAGRPIIGSLRGDAASIIQASGAGLVIDPGDAEGLAQAVRRIYSLPVDERNAMAAAARDHYGTNFSQARVADDLARLLTEASRSSR